MAIGEFNFVLASCFSEFSDQLLVEADEDVTFEHGECTGATPGQLLRHGQADVA